MNIIKKIYCRTFQKALRIALPILPYREPKQLNSFEEVVETLKNKKIDKVLLVTDKIIIQNGLTKELTSCLEENDISYYLYDQVIANPTIQNVEEARTMYMHNDCKGMIAIGGGSVIDCAKGCGARLARPKKEISKMRGILQVLLPTPLTIAIPTTAGTGSETTLAAVITDPDKKYKYPINDFPLIPDYAVLVPSLTKDLPKHMTATTGMDALTHAVEAYIGHSTNRYTRKMSEDAVKLIYENLYTAYQDGHNLVARKNMLQAAYYAGLSFTRSYVGYVHGIAHSLGGQYHIPHGLANAIILPYFLDAYGSSIYKKLAILSRKAGISSSTSDEIAAKEFISWVKKMNKDMEIPTSIPEIQEEDILTMARHADVESNPLYPVPVLMDQKELEKMYYIIKEGNREVEYAA